MGTQICKAHRMHKEDNSAQNNTGHPCQDRN